MTKNYPDDRRFMTHEQRAEDDPRYRHSKGTVSDRRNLYYYHVKQMKTAKENRDHEAFLLHSKKASELLKTLP